MLSHNVTPDRPSFVGKVVLLKILFYMTFIC